MSLKEKSYAFGYRTIAPSSVGKSLFTSSLAQWRDVPPEWGGGMEGYGRRFGHRMAVRGVENAIGLPVAAALHQDPRYFRLGEGSIGRRSLHAIGYALVTRRDDGGRGFAAWRVAGSYGAQFAANAWRPSDNGPGDALIRGTISIGYAAASNWFREFWPDIRRKVLKQ